MWSMRLAGTGLVFVALFSFVNAVAPEPVAVTSEDVWCHTFSIVAYAQSKLLTVITDFNLDVPCLRVAKGVPQRFGSDFVNLVAQDGMQISRLALDGDTECRSVIG